MGKTVTHKLIEDHLVEGRAEPGEEIGIRIDQTLTQDATGTLAMLALEAMNADRVQTELSVQYVDHNILQEDHKNADDHRFLHSACRRYGVWFSRPGNGVSHPVHQERFGAPGKTLLGSDSHTPAAGAMGMLAIGAGGLDVALAMVGEPFRMRMPKVWGVKLVGALPDWVSAKDVILELLRRHDVDGGLGRIIEYYGPGLACLSAMDRHVIANMGTELGATTSVFPSDAQVRTFMRAQQREAAWQALAADPDADYDVHEEIDLSRLEPLIAMPSSPGNVVPVREVAGKEIHQAYIGSSANPGYRDFAIAACMVRDRFIPAGVSFDVNPTSRQMLANLMREGHIEALVRAGARLHQAGCNGCIGMGQAPATNTISLRTVPRNFPGRSGTREDKVCLVSPETATASALAGRITDPRDLSWMKSKEMAYPRVREPESPIIDAAMLEPPADEAEGVELVKGPNIKALPVFDPLPDTLEAPVLLVVGDHVSTDEILPAGTRVLPFRSNIPKISEFAFEGVDPSYPKRARQVKGGVHAVVGGTNYGQGSSREHAALAPRYLGLRLVVAKRFARIHLENLVNFGILPVVFQDARDYERIKQGDVLRCEQVADQIASSRTARIRNITRDFAFQVEHDLSRRQIEILRLGGLFAWVTARFRSREEALRA
jgi:aconitate hydratase